MRTNGANQSLLGGVAAGVYPAILQVHSRDVTGFENFRAGDTTDGYAIPRNFLAASQTLIDNMATEVAGKYSGGNHLVNNAEATKWRFGKWCAPLKVKNIKISPLGKARSAAITNRWTTTAGAVKSVALGTGKVCFVWPVYLASGQYAFYMRAASFGAGGVTWGAEARVGTVISNADGALTWAIAKQATDKVIIYFSDQANSNYFSGVAFSVSGVTYSAVGATLQIAATASAAIYSACNAASDKSIVATNITADYAYCCTTSTLTITAGTGVDVQGTPTGQQVVLQYVSDNNILCIYGNTSASGAMYGRLLTIVTRTITANAEGSVNCGAGVNLTALNAQMLTTTLGVSHFYGSSVYHLYLTTTISGTNVTLVIWTSALGNPFDSTQYGVILAADTTNSEVWGVGNDSGSDQGFVYKIKAATSTTLACNTPSSYEYKFESTACMLDLTHFSTSLVHQQRIASLANGNGFYGYGLATGNDAYKLVINMISKIQVDITINSSTAYDASTGVNGQSCAVNHDISSLGYAEITLTNNIGNFTGYMLDQILLTCT